MTPEKRREQNRKSVHKYRQTEKGKETHKLACKKYQLKNPEKVKEWTNASCRKRRTGFTKEEFRLKITEQNQKCSICHKPFPENLKHIHADHNHTTKQKRGVLCSKCNQALGLLDENISIMQSMITYLNKWNSEDNDGRKGIHIQTAT